MMFPVSKGVVGGDQKFALRVHFIRRFSCKFFGKLTTARNE